MICGAHTIIFSTDAEADRVFFRDVLELDHVDAGDGWLIFALPPTELAFHPDNKSFHQLYLICEDINAFVEKMGQHGVACTAIEEHDWGLLTTIDLPGGGQLSVYEARHQHP